MSSEADIVIIGAGIAGLAVAARVAREGRSVYIFEKNEAFGRETSSRNSGTIHTGILSPAGTLNASLCQEGSRRLYQICGEYGVEHRRTGKLLVAAGEGELERLEALYQRREEGIEIQRLSLAEMRRLEPEVQGEAGLLLPGAGVVDAYGLMRCFLGQACLKEAQLVCRAEVRRIEREAAGYLVRIRDEGGDTALKTRVVINCAGLQSDRIASLAGIDIDKAGYRQIYFKGEYYSLAASIAGRVGRRLIYPLLKTGGLVGIHTVLDVDGRVRLGPDFYPVEKIEYAMDDARRAIFVEGARKLFPFVSAADVEPESCGVMPRAYGLNESFRSFVVRHENERGLPGFINVLGIESPGLTASPAIAECVAGLVNEVLD
jgi:L-2-hydroxyglutarate oxidase LhgO